MFHTLYRKVKICIGGSIERHKTRVFKTFFNNLNEEERIKRMVENAWLIDKNGIGYIFKKVEKDTTTYGWLLDRYYKKCD